MFYVNGGATLLADEKPTFVVTAATTGGEDLNPHLIVLQFDIVISSD